MSGITLKGVAFLCFAEDDSRFQGVIVTNTGSQFGLAGKEGEIPDGNFHQCCFDVTPKFYDVTIKDETSLEFDDEITVRHVMRIGGDNCSLKSDHIDFTTDQLLVGQRAEEHIRKYFPARFLDQNCYICIGDMLINNNSEN